MLKKFKTKTALIFAVIVFICSFFAQAFNPNMNAYAYSHMPFYDLRPEELVVRSSFFTTYRSSTEERKTNISLAVDYINNTFLDVGEEFSFNEVVGERTKERGFMPAKIIVNGEFTDGVGGGVCQVSTTLYNAVLLSGLKITEYHPHTLPVSYIAPSFDAMVNSGSADLRFINDTHNPIIISASADGEILRISITGEPSKYKYIRKSVIVEEIPAPKEENIYDYDGEYPELFEGESKVISYSKNGYKSEGYLIKYYNGKKIGEKRIRKDTYSARKGKIIYGKTLRN